MSLRQVQCSWDVFHACSVHALSTEREEIMGLLLGDWESNAQGEHAVAFVRDITIMVRSDRRKDRVEISPEQLVEASDEAAAVEKRTGQRTRVIGWYHSHPHITVFPSHVDNRTQGQFQAMDSGFIGLIFSVFNHNERDRAGQLLVTAFQASGSAAAGWQRRDVPLSLHAHVGGAGGGASAIRLCDAMRRLAELQRTLFEEERGLFVASAAQAPAHGLQRAHASAVYQKALCQLLELCTLPLRQAVQGQLDRLRQQEIPALKAENARLRQLCSQGQQCQSQSQSQSQSGGGGASCQLST